MQDNGVFLGIDFSHRKIYFFVHAAAEFELITDEHGRHAASADRGNAEPAHGRDPFEEGERAERRDNADGLSAKGEAVAAVRKARPTHRVLPHRHAARKKVFLALPMAVKGAGKAGDGDEQDHPARENERDGRAFDEIALPLSIGDPEKGVDGNEHSAEDKGERKKGAGGDETRFDPSLRGKERKEDPAEKFHEIGKGGGQ